LNHTITNTPVWKNTITIHLFINIPLQFAVYTIHAILYVFIYVRPTSSVYSDTDF